MSNVRTTLLRIFQGVRCTSANKETGVVHRRDRCLGEMHPQQRYSFHFCCFSLRER